MPLPATRALVAIAATLAVAIAPLSSARADSIIDGKLSGDLDGTTGGLLSGALPPIRFNFETRERKRVCRTNGSGCTYADIQGEPYDCRQMRNGCLACKALTVQGSPMTIQWGPERGWGHCP